MSQHEVGAEGLVRTLGAVAAGAFVVTNMIGSGIFTVPAFVRVATGGALASLGVWAAAGFLALCGALCYSELATHMPTAGGEYRYLTRGLGRVWGFLSGWTSFVVGFSAAMAASALGVMAYVAPLFDGWHPDTPLMGTAGITQGAVAASALVLILTLVHSVDVRRSGGFQTLLATMVVGSIVVMVLAGFSTGNGSWSGLVARSDPRSNWWVALLQVTYAYAGWNAAAYIAGEVRDPAKNLPKAILGGTLFVTALYLLINALFFYALPHAEWDPAIAVGQLAAESLFGLQGSLAVTSIIALAMFGSVSAMTAVGPRIYCAMARDGVAPRFLGRISDQGHVPVAAIVAQGILAAALALTGAFETLLIYIGSSLLLFNGLTVVTLFVFRRRDANAEGAEEARPEIFRTPLHPLPALIFLGVTITAWVNGLLGAPIPTGAALATLALGACVYAIGRRRSWFAA